MNPPPTKENPMGWKKAPPAVVAVFEALVPKRPDVQRRQMFGYPAAFVNGRMFAGLHEDRLVLRLDDQAIAAAKRRGAIDFEPMSGRAMTGWVAVPRRLLADEDVVRGWIDAAFRHVASIPAKKPRGGRRPRAR